MILRVSARIDLKISLFNVFCGGLDLEILNLVKYGPIASHVPLFPNSKLSLNVTVNLEQ